MSVPYKPDGYSTISPYLIASDAAAAIHFYIAAFGATERMRLSGPGDSVMHAELEIGDSVIMIADEFPEMSALGPETIGGTPVGLFLYVEDCDAVVEKAVDLGAILERPAEDQFYGDRTGTLRDPFGHRWTITTHIEDVSPEEMERRMAEMMGGGVE